MELSWARRKLRHCRRHHCGNTVLLPPKIETAESLIDGNFYGAASRRRRRHHEKVPITQEIMPLTIAVTVLDDINRIVGYPDEFSRSAERSLVSNCAVQLWLL